MKPKKLMLIAMAMLCSGGIFLQNAYGQTDPQKKATLLKGKLDTLREVSDKDNQIITDDNFDKKLDSVLNTVSGFSYKNGKATRTAAVIDDKSLTFNFNVLDKKWYTLQFTASGAAEKSIVDIFKDGEYQKTFSGGVNAIIFTPFNRASFNSESKSALKTQMDIVHNYYAQKATKCPAISDISFLIQEYSKGNSFLLGKAPIPDDEVLTYDAKRAKLLKLIEQYKQYLPEKFLELDFSLQRAAVDKLVGQEKIICENSFMQQEVDSINNLQLQTKFSGTLLSWLNFSGKFNTEKYPIFDPENTKKYASPFSDNYWSFAAGINIAYIRKRVTYLISPTFKYTNSRDFDDTNIRSLNIPNGTQQLINGVAQSEYTATSYYPSIADVKAYTNMEIPLIIVWPKSSFGFDLALNTDIAPKWKNLGARFGIFIPIPSGEQKIIIEPLVKLKKLDDKSLDFKKEQISFGINLTVTLPEFITGKKK